MKESFTICVYLTINFNSKFIKNNKNKITKTHLKELFNNLSIEIIFVIIQNIIGKYEKKIYQLFQPKSYFFNYFFHNHANSYLIIFQ